jgi:hypothetical protein
MLSRLRERPSPDLLQRISPARMAFRIAKNNRQHYVFKTKFFILCLI